MNLSPAFIVFLLFLCLLIYRHHRCACRLNSCFWLLTVFFFLLALWLLYNIVVLLAVQMHYRHIMAWLIPLDLCIGPWVSPVLYFYLKKVTGDTVRAGWPRNVHFIYPALTMISMVYFLFQSPDVRIQAFQSDRFDNLPLVPVLRIGLCLQTIIYVVLTRRVLHHSGVSDYNLEVGGISLSVRWLAVFLLTNMFCLVAHCVLCFVSASSLLHLHLRLSVFVFWTVVMIDRNLGFAGNKSFESILKQAKSTMVRSKNRLKMQKRITNSVAEQVMERLREVMKREQLYLNKECSLDMLADKLVISRHELSYVLNSYFESGFVDLIHHYRIAHALELMHAGACQLHTVEHIALLSGYNVVSTFNREFKKRQGINPREYIREMKRSANC